INGQFRPRPSKFKIDEKTADALEKGKNTELKDAYEKEMLTKYFGAIELFITETEKYFQSINKEDVKKGHTILDDLKDFEEGFTEKYKEKFLKYYESDSPKSDLF